MRSAVVFGSAITSARQNGATIFFRGLCRALARAGLRTIFAEEARGLAPDRDLPDEVVIRHYSTAADASEILASAPPPRLLLKFVACGSLDGPLEETILSRRQAADFLLFVDGDAPVTLEQVYRSPGHYLRMTVPRFDGVLVLAGGERAAREYLALGARRVSWGYCAVDEGFWRPIPASVDLACDLLFVGNRLADRETRVQEFFLRPAAICPERRFLLTGAGWEDVALPPNVNWPGHLSPFDLRLAYASAGLVLNVNRVPMARYGYSPASRLFEAASCGACILSDRWPGIEEVFEPGQQIVVADGGTDVTSALRGLSPAVRKGIGRAARQRIEHDYTCDAWVKRLLQTLTAWESTSTATAGQCTVTRGN